MATEPLSEWLLRQQPSPNHLEPGDWRLCLGMHDRDDLIAKVQTLEEAEQDLRREWWTNHGCPISALYGDDGEMQCGIHAADFKRQNIDELRMLVFTARLEKVAKEMS